VPPAGREWSVKPLFPTLSMQVTYQCNVECRHCGPFCGPRERDWMTPEEMRDLIAQAAELGAQSVVLTGGEPTLLGRELPALLRFIRDEAGVPSSRLVTNAKWAVTYDHARALLSGWKDAGLVEINVSCGEYHQEFIPVSSVVNAWRAARDLDFATVLLAGEFIDPSRAKFPPRVFRDAVGEDLLPPELMSPFSRRVHGMSCGSAMNWGRGRQMLREEDLIRQDEADIPTLCTDVLSAITVHPNGNTTACCGVMVRERSLLHIGNWREQRLRPLVEAANDDLVLNWIRNLGLKDMKRWLQEKDPSLTFPERYVSICDLCATMLHDKRCEELLLRHGAERRDEIVAARVAFEAALAAPDGE
jgi:radical SAM family protein